MTDEQSDQQLIARVILGDRDAFRLLFDRYQKPLLNFAYRYLGRHEEAEEVVQETFMRLFRHIKRFDPARPLKPWLYQIAVNVTRGRGSRLARHSTAGGEALAASVDPGRAPDAELQASEDAQSVRQAIAQLPEQQRLVFILATYQGLEYPALAQILGIPLGTVKSRMHRAIRLLRERLQGLLP